MNQITLPYEIRDVHDTDGGLHFDLHVEGKRIATEAIAGDVLDDMCHLTGETRESVAEAMQRDLLAYLEHQLATATLTTPQEDSQRPLRFQSKYTYKWWDVDQKVDKVIRGYVWYDVENAETGPESVPAIVRNKLRHEVHRLLTIEGSQAREIVDLSR
jgi:hypothetical protein